MKKIVKNIQSAKKNNKKNSNLKIATEVVNAEITNLQLMLAQFNDEGFNKTFLQILSTLKNCKGRVLVTGIGKSGIIGKKVSGIFSSIGIASFFVHPVEAIHGDLGCICNDDVLLSLSCSGNTIELQNIVNYCNKHGIITLAITCKTDSWLEKNSKITLVLNMQSEAIRNFPIPTTSSMLTLAVCDALTACLVEEKKLSYQEYGEIHCGGKIGETINNAILKKKESKKD